MYHTCIYCHRDLGANEAVQSFPVGRRLAFDADRGRLWVICHACRRWNLSPIEERWEAIEECEVLFRGTPTRFSTDQIGLGKLPEGLELVRIGNPGRREFAAWRYAERFARRRLGGAVRHLMQGGLQTLTSILTLVPGLGRLASAGIELERGPIVLRVPLRDGTLAALAREDLARIRLEPSAHPEGFTLNLIYWHAISPRRRRDRRSGEARTFRLYGTEAVQEAGRILPWINGLGGSRVQVDDAVSYVEAVNGEAKRLFSSVPAIVPESPRISMLPVRIRLAMEMAAHEDTERRALEGELYLLEEQWREAEEIAAIADRLLVPASVEEWIRRWRGSGSADDR